MGSQRYIKIILAGLLFAWLAGCSTTGGDILGLFPAPKILKGSIENNVYTSKDKLFSIAVPHKQGSYEYKYMQVKEEYTPHNDYVSFGPAAFDQSIFRVNFTMRATPGSLQPGFDEIAPKIHEASEKQILTGYGGTITDIKSSQTRVNGYPAYYWQFQQKVPAGKLSNQPEMLTHDLYVINYGYAIATIWVQRPIGPGVPAIKDVPTAEEFADSLTLLPVETDATRRMTPGGEYRFPDDPITVSTPAVLCGIHGIIADSYDDKHFVDFSAPDNLWQIAGDYYVELFPIPKEVTGQKSFYGYSSKLLVGLIQTDDEPLGVHPKLTGTETIDNLGMPAVRATGVEENKDMLVVTVELGKSRIIAVALLYPLHYGESPESAFPWDCYNKFLHSVKEQDSITN